MSEELRTVGRTTTIITFKPYGSVLLPYLCKVKVPARVANENVKDESFRQAVREES